MTISGTRIDPRSCGRAPLSMPSLRQTAERSRLYFATTNWLSASPGIPAVPSEATARALGITSTSGRARVLRDQRKWSQGVELEGSDRLLIEAIARSERHGEVGHFGPARTLRSPGFNQLRHKLNLKLKNQIILPYIPAEQSSPTGSSGLPSRSLIPPLE